MISPFVTYQAVKHLSNEFDLKNFKLITRFNLDDFFIGVSSLDALKFLKKSGAGIKGIKGLHAKIFIFENNGVLVSSSNFTTGGMYKNYELGIYTDDKSIVKEINDHFAELWNISGDDLSLKIISEWERKILNHKIQNPLFKKKTLGDFGKQLEKEELEDPVIDAIREFSSIDTVNTSDTSIRYFLKFMGTGGDREDALADISDIIRRSECHYAVTHSFHPRLIKNGDILYYAYMTKDPDDYAIFGKAYALEHNDIRDVATKNERERTKNRLDPNKRWKDTWPNYTRLYNPFFIKGCLGDGVYFYRDIESQLKYRSLVSTLKNYNNKSGNIIPRKSLQQKSFAEITLEAALLIDNLLKERLRQRGKISRGFLASLPKSDIDLRITNT